MKEKEIKKILSIDLGNGYVKGVIDGKVFIFRSAFKEGVKDDGISKGYNVNFNGVDYVVGDGNQATTIIDKKVEDISTLLFILNAANIAFPNENNIEFELALGLPAKYYNSYKEKLRKYVNENLKTTTAKFDGKTKLISIKKVNIGMQAAVYSTNVELFEGKSVLVIDVGAGTIDGVLFDDFQLDSRVFTFENGMINFWNSLMNNLNAEIPGTKFRKAQDVEKYVKRGYFTFERTKHYINDIRSPFHSVIQKTLEEYFGEALATIANTYTVDMLDDVVLTGGAASFLKNYFESVLGKCEIIEVDEDIFDIDGNKLSDDEVQQYTNAINYYNIITN